MVNCRKCGGQLFVLSRGLVGCVWCGLPITGYQARRIRTDIADTLYRLCHSPREVRRGALAALATA